MIVFVICKTNKMCSPRKKMKSSSILYLCADGLMDVQEECAKFGVVRGFKYDGDSTAGYKVM